MKCNNCGKMLEDTNYTFCSNCGNKLNNCVNDDKKNDVPKYNSINIKICIIMLLFTFWSCSYIN